MIPQRFSFLYEQIIIENVWGTDRLWDMMWYLWNIYILLMQIFQM